MDGWLHVSIETPLATLVRFHPVARVLRIGPRIAIDGQVVSREYRKVSLQLAPGPHQLEVWMQWVAKLAVASARFDIEPGSSIVARYRIVRGPSGVLDLGPAKAS